jgi:hypothetical protein
MLKPLGLPPGSVRALLLLALVARAILDLKDGVELAPWLLVALLVSAAAYFSARAVGRIGAADPAAPKPRHPLGLPAGTIRLLFLLALAVGAYFWFRHHEAGEANVPVVWVAGAFVFGVLVRWFGRRLRRPEDPSTGWFWHLQALVALIAAAGLVTFAVRAPEGVPDWVEPLLAAVVTYYFGSR